MRREIFLTPQTQLQSRTTRRIPGLCGIFVLRVIFTHWCFGSDVTECLGVMCKPWHFLHLKHSTLAYSRERKNPESIYKLPHSQWLRATGFPVCCCMFCPCCAWPVWSQSAACPVWSQSAAACPDHVVHVLYDFSSDLGCTLVMTSCCLYHATGEWWQQPRVYTLI